MATEGRVEGPETTVVPEKDTVSAEAVPGARQRSSPPCDPNLHCGVHAAPVT